MKSLLEKKEKITAEEWRILKFMEFYCQRYDAKYVDKYQCNQVVDVNLRDKYKIHYELKYDCNKQLKIVNKNIEKIEVMYGT